MGISCGNQRHKKIILVMIIPLIQAGDNVLRDAERHILRLRGELVAVKAAREAVMAEADNLFFSKLLSIKPFDGNSFGRNLSLKSSAAVQDLVKGSINATPAEWQRARH